MPSFVLPSRLFEEFPASQSFFTHFRGTSVENLRGDVRLMKELQAHAQRVVQVVEKVIARVDCAQKVRKSGVSNRQGGKRRHLQVSRKLGGEGGGGTDRVVNLFLFVCVELTPGELLSVCGRLPSLMSLRLLVLNVHPDKKTHIRSTGILQYMYLCTAYTGRCVVDAMQKK